MQLAHDQLPDLHKAHQSHNHSEYLELDKCQDADADQKRGPIGLSLRHVLPCEAPDREESRVAAEDDDVCVGLRQPERRRLDLQQRSFHFLNGLGRRLFQAAASRVSGEALAT